MRKLYSKVLLVVAAVAGAAILVPAISSAQNEPAVRGSGLQISPTRFEVVAEEGSERSIDIDLKNVSGADVVAKAYVNDFVADDQTGAPKIVTDKNASSQYSITRFVKGLADVPLVNNETKKLKLSLSIPKGTAAGAYYGVIRYQAVPAGQAAEPQQISLTASVGEIVLIEVPGDITEGLQIKELKLSGGTKLGGIFYKKPSEAQLTLRNTGNSFIKPFGVVTLNKGSKEVYNYEANNTDPKGNVLPNSNRTFKNELKNIGPLGRYALTANIGYGKSGNVVTFKKVFWVVPLWMIIGLVVILLAIIGTITYFVYRKKYTKKRKKSSKS